MDLTQMESNEVMLNGKKITQEQLQENIESAEQKKGVRIIEVRPNEYKTQIQG